MSRHALLFLVSLLALSGGTGCQVQLSDTVRRDISAQMAATHRGVAACYQDALVRNPNLAGTLTVQFMVANYTGRFQNVQFSGVINDPNLLRCVRTLTESRRTLQPPPRPVMVTFPIVFEVTAPAAPPPA
jgi:hypothetical protein